MKGKKIFKQRLSEIILLIRESSLLRQYHVEVVNAESYLLVLMALQ
jgi:hypothetical protein